MYAMIYHDLDPGVVLATLGAKVKASDFVIYLPCTVERVGDEFVVHTSNTTLFRNSDICGPVCEDLVVAALQTALDHLRADGDSS